MSARGDLIGDSPHACPFVALEGDRDGRSDSPDLRHRCYAEPTPQPRALPHQEAFCLSPTFAGCPIFQDWAARAAARPLSPVAAASAATEQLGVFDAVDAPPPGADPIAADTPAGSDLPDYLVELSAPAEGADAVEPSTPADPVDPVMPLHTDLDPATPDHEIPSPYSRKASMEDVSEEDEIPPVPPFLTGRSGAESLVAGTTASPPMSSEMPTVSPGDFGHAAPTDALHRQVEIPPPSPRSSMPRGVPSERVERENVVPSWEIDGRFGAQLEPELSDDRNGGWLTALAVVAILALGVAGVIFLPGLLAGTPNRSPTAGPTSVPSLVSTITAPVATATDAIPTQAATATPGETGPTVEPTVGATPRLYRIKAGDSLARIARRNDVTVEDILAANPEITNPNQIQVGQLIVIPQPPPTAAP